MNYYDYDCVNANWIYTIRINNRVFSCLSYTLSTKNISTEKSIDQKTKRRMLLYGTIAWTILGLFLELLD
ncbi:hypothetical protein Psch_00656 [Pelotomaculum schinkii]|uniref:Uncharacterized protein n=1 Tax=Pelotomaculum schinkii TaxID=78350 RepID=A0A4Y7REA8_9FIRM|nr:hypothetical protein Psch_00656 [Pelotomaculum schinkii]